MLVVALACIVAVCATDPLASSGAASGNSSQRSDGIQYLPLPADPASGGRLFIAKGCIRCHAVRGEGGSVGPDLGRSAFGLNLTEIAAAMWNHAPAMSRQMELLGIERPQFAAGEMQALVAFLYYLNFSDPAGDPERGRAVFESKACTRCHAVAGRGGRHGPSLDRLLQEYVSPVVLAQRMWNHGPQMLDTMRRLGIEVPTLSSGDVADLVAYLRATTAVGPGGRSYRTPGDPARGELAFRSKGCSGCHAVWGRGGGIGPDLADADLGTSVTEIAARMWNHWPQMWRRMQQERIARPLFTEAEMTDLLSYLYSIHYGGKAGDRRRGAALFDEKGCHTCHAVGGVGGSVGPDLARSAAAQSLNEGVRLLWNHAAAMQKKMRGRGVIWPELNGDEIRDMLTYLRASRVAKH